jgi:hypothetical protein
MWFFKKKTIVVDCFTDEASAYDFYPIKNSKSYYPEWWKNVQNTIVQETPAGPIDRPTIKFCDGILNLYKNSFVLPSWTDIQIKTTYDSFYIMLAKQCVNQSYPMFENHGRSQHSDIFDNKIHMKLMSPWFLKQNNKCNFAMMPAVWHDPNNWANYTILPGMIDFKYQHSTNINFFLEPNKDRIFIEAGTPFYHIIPLTDETVEFKCHLVTTDELNRIYHSKYGSFSGAYKKAKRHGQETEKSCPFNMFKT